MLNLRKNTKQQKTPSKATMDLLISIHCMAVSQSIMDYMDHKIENYNDLPEFVKAAMGA